MDAFTRTHLELSAKGRSQTLAMSPVHTRVCTYVCMLIWVLTFPVTELCSPWSLKETSKQLLPHTYLNFSFGNLLQSSDVPCQRVKECV